MSSPVTNQRRWEPGDQVLVEMMGFEDPFRSVPVTVVSDTSDLVAFYVADGTAYRELVLEDETPILRVVLPEVFERLRKKSILAQFNHRVDLFSPHPMRHMPGWTPYEWYVNMQEPFQRTDIGFCSTDQGMNIVVEPDFTWHWKDEDELVEFIGIGRFTLGEGCANHTTTASWGGMGDRGDDGMRGP